MNENRERGTLHYKFLTTIAIVALLIGSNTALAIGTNSEGLSEVAEQLQSQVVNGTVTDQTGRACYRSKCSGKRNKQWYYYQYRW